MRPRNVRGGSSGRCALSARRFLVTGGAGFIGSHLVETLLVHGRSVTVLDDFSSGFRANLEGLAGDLRVIEGSILSDDDCAKAMEGVVAVSHQAAFGSVPRSIVSPELYSSNNVHGTVNVLRHARAAGVRRVAMASSSSVYGDSVRLPKREPDLGNPLSPYAASKRACELFAQAFAATGAMELVCMRYFNVFGPRQNPRGPYAAVIPLFVAALLEGRQATIHGDGEQGRDFTYVANVVAANLAALEGTVAPGCHVVNVACGGTTTVNELYRHLKEACGSTVEAHHGPDRPGDIRDSMADITLAGTLLGYVPGTTLAEGLARTLEWYRAHPERIA